MNKNQLNFLVHKAATLAWAIEKLSREQIPDSMGELLCQESQVVADDLYESLEILRTENDRPENPPEVLEYEHG